MKRTIILWFILFCLSGLHAQHYQPAPQNLVNRVWFQDARFGMFIHWGVYAVLGSGEWVMNIQHIDKKTYEKLPLFFNPVDFISLLFLISI